MDLFDNRFYLPLIIYKIIGFALMSVIVDYIEKL